MLEKDIENLIAEHPDDIFPEKEESIAVEMTILKRLINKPILKKTLLEINGLGNLSILRRPQGTNFPVRNSEWRIISQFL
jgi:hypothetical protein